MSSIFFRVVIMYLLLTVVLRLMGKRQVGEMQVSDLVPTLLLSEIAALPIDDSDIPLLHAVIPILFLFSAEVLITYAKTKWNPLKKVLESRPIFLIERGQLRQEELAKNRITLTEFLGECRLQGVADIRNIYYAILEQDGKMSIMQRAKGGGADPGIPHLLVADGVINREAAEKIGMTADTVKAIARQEGYRAEDLFLLQKDDAGQVYSIPKERKK